MRGHSGRRAAHCAVLSVRATWFDDALDDDHLNVDVAGHIGQELGDEVVDGDRGGCFMRPALRPFRSDWGSGFAPSP